MDHFNVITADERADFGLPVPKDIKTYKLDSLIYVSDSVSVMVRKEYSRLNTEPASAAKFTTTRIDTMYSDPLFSRKHSLDSIKNVLKTNYAFINSVNKVVFVGYDNKKNKEKNKNKDTDKEMKNNIIPVTMIDNGSGNPGSPFDKTLGLMLGTILLLALVGGWLSWKLYQPRLQ